MERRARVVLELGGSLRRRKLVRRLPLLPLGDGEELGDPVVAARHLLRQRAHLRDQLALGSLGLLTQGREFDESRVERLLQPRYSLLRQGEGLPQAHILHAERSSNAAMNRLRLRKT